VAKLYAYWITINYREAYGIYACNGILFNHESPLRPPRFVTRKIVDAALAIAAGAPGPLVLGNLDVERDWGWSPEYVRAMWAMLQTDCREDFVIATGRTYPLREFVATAFAEVGLDWRDHVIQDPALMRRAEIAYSRGDAEKASRMLGWRATVTMPEVVRRMVAELSVRMA
jgi:GDPmannose 4,6-dehydratase